MRVKLKLCLLLVVFLSWFNQNCTVAQEEKYIGLFLYNFSKYYNWNEANGDFIIQVLGHKAVYDELARIAKGKMVGNQRIVVKSVTLETISDSHMFFVGHWKSRYMEDVKRKLAGRRPTLIITEKEGMLQQGAAVNFIIFNGEIKFEISLSNVPKGINVDPRIKKLALRVVD